ncbi:MAG: hypothetical protein HKP61_23365 [Dactylosporangium sp.]|nr:hypothetical protein [Dactylosporangium sp.]NNJ63819.1 hypothetical protein [Dactylosporangium sp.]
MKQRWLPVGVFAGVLFAVNIVARLVVRLAAGEDDGKQIWIGLVALVAVALVTLVAAVRWAPRYPMPRVVGDLVLGVLAGCLLSTLIGPFISRGEAFGGGFGYFLAQLFYYLMICALGAFFGVLAVMAFGRDYKSRGWQRFAQTVQAKPHRVGRR